MAITTVTYSPNSFSPVYNPIVWSCFSSESSQPNMKYVFDIYFDDSATRTLRVKQRPNPSGYGMIDISSIAQAYVDWSNLSAPVTNGETTIDYTAGHLYSGNDYLSRKVLVKVGEEVNGITYTGYGTSEGNPAYPLYSWPSVYSNVQVKFWPAYLESRLANWHMQRSSSVAHGVFSGDVSFNFDNRVFSTTSLAYPLSLGSLEKEVYSFDKLTLSFLNFNSTLSTTYNRIYGFRFVFKTSSGTTISTDDVPMITSTGIAQRDRDYDVTASQNAEFDIVHVLASPADVVTALGLGQTVTLSAGTQLWITGYKQSAPGSTHFGSKPVTETVKLTIKEYCSDPMYPRVRLSWLNSLGGRDYANFTAFFEKTVSTKSETFFTDSINWSGTTPLVSDGSYPVGRSPIEGGTKPYNKQVTTSFNIESDWLTQDQVNLLESLQSSSQVLAYIHDEDSSASDRYPYSVRIADSSYSVRNVRQTKMVQAKFKLEVTSPQKIQVTI